MILKTQLHVGLGHPLEKIKNPISNHIMCKANGGLYTSTYLGQDVGSDWLQWCIANEFNIPEDGIWKCWLINIKKDANIFVVDNVDDMHELYDRYEHPMFEGSRTMQIDYTKMSKDYDGIHMTRRGERATRHGNIFSRTSNMARDSRNMYGWDVESTHFFRDVFKNIIPIELKSIEDTEKFMFKLLLDVEKNL
jgi:hypothetical protein